MSFSFGAEHSYRSQTVGWLEDGVIVKGVVRPKEFGNPEGTSELSKIFGKKIRMSQELASSRHQVMDGQVEQVFGAVKRKMNTFDVHSSFETTDTGAKVLQDECSVVGVPKKKAQRRRVLIRMVFRGPQQLP
jgi:hypothetical protein